MAVALCRALMIKAIPSSATRSLITSSSLSVPQIPLSVRSFTHLTRVRPLVSLNRFPPTTTFGGLKCLSTRPTSSSLNDPQPNWNNRPPKETILLDGCDFEHWLIVMEKPEGEPTRDEIIDSYINTLSKVMGSEDEARMKIYSVSTRHYFAFGALVSEEVSYKIKELPGVRWVLPDSYLNVREKDYGGEPFIDGKAVPYDPKYHEEWVRNNARANERSRRNDRPRNNDRSRNFERRRENMQSRDFQPNQPGSPPGGMPHNPTMQNPGGMPHNPIMQNPGGMPPNRNLQNPGPNIGGMPPNSNMQSRDFQPNQPGSPSGGMPHNPIMQNPGGMPPNRNLLNPGPNTGGMPPISNMQSRDFQPNQPGSPPGGMPHNPNMQNPGGMPPNLNFQNPGPNMVGMPPNSNMQNPGQNMGGMPPNGNMHPNMGGPPGANMQPNMGGMQHNAYARNMEGMPPNANMRGPPPPNAGYYNNIAPNNGGQYRDAPPQGGGAPYQGEPPRDFNPNGDYQ